MFKKLRVVLSIQDGKSAAPRPVANAAARFPCVDDPRLWQFLGLFCSLAAQHIIRAAMDAATKEGLLLLNLLRNLRHAVEQQYYINEMAWRTYSALVQMFPEFPEKYREADKHVSFSELRRWRAEQLRQFDAAILLVESWREE